MRKDSRVKLHEIVQHLLEKVSATNEKIVESNTLDENLDEAWKIFEEKFPYYSKI